MSGRQWTFFIFWFFKPKKSTVATEREKIKNLGTLATLQGYFPHDD
jgi:hypothetical protein